MLFFNIYFWLSHIFPWWERNKVLDYVEKFKPYVELNINSVDYLLVHGGLENFSVEKSIADYSLEELVWDRPDYSKKY